MFDILPQGFASFGLIGVVGLLVDLSVLQSVIIVGGVDPFVARFTTFPIPIFVTWLLNRRYTFKDRSTSNKSKEYTLYLLIQTIGLGINFSVYSLTLVTLPAAVYAPVIAQILGSATTMVFNFFAARRYAFTGG